VFAFTAFVNWTANGRTLLPMAPAVAVLIVRKISAGEGLLPKIRWPAFSLAMACAAMLAALTAIADYTLANSARTAARDLVERYKSEDGTVWFRAHWGFQYYAELEGAKAFDRTTTCFCDGDKLILSMNNVAPVLVDPFGDKSERHEYPVFPFLTIWSRTLDAAFYWDGFGPLPFTIGNVPGEAYLVGIIDKELGSSLNRAECISEARDVQQPANTLNSDAATGQNAAASGDTFTKHDPSSGGPRDAP
jgi:hypothetical protein